MATSYSNRRGSGDRRRLIAVSTNGAGGVGSMLRPWNAVNGSTASDSSNSWWWNNGSASGVYLRFDFGGVPVVIDEAKWYQSGSVAHGVFQWQGSNDASSWTDIGASFTLGGAATQTHTELNGNATAYKYYQLLGLSGTTRNDDYLQEIEFRIDDPDPNSSYANAGGVGDRTAIITASNSASLFNTGSAANLINGHTNDAWFLSGAPAAGEWIQFDFGSGEEKTITGAAWIQGDGRNTHGVWKWQGSNDASSWTDIGASFTLGAVDGYAGDDQSVQLQSTLAGNTAGYRYYRLLGVSGNTSNDPWLRDIDFFIGDYVATGPSGTFECHARTSVAFTGPSPVGTFACDALTDVSFVAPVPSNFWNVAATTDVEFAATPRGYFHCDPQTDVEFADAYARGAVRFTCDALTSVIWLGDGGIVQYPCLTGDGVFATPAEPEDQRLGNYVF